MLLLCSLFDLPKVRMQNEFSNQFFLIANKTRQKDFNKIKSFKPFSSLKIKTASFQKRLLDCLPNKNL